VVVLGLVRFLVHGDEEGVDHQHSRIFLSDNRWREMGTDKWGAAGSCWGGITSRLGCEAAGVGGGWGGCAGVGLGFMHGSQRMPRSRRGVDCDRAGGKKTMSRQEWDVEYISSRPPSGPAMCLPLDRITYLPSLLCVVMPARPSHDSRGCS